MTAIRIARAALTGVVALVLAAAGAAEGAQPLEPGRVLVAPFETEGEPRAAWLGEGVAILLADDLAELGVDAIMYDERVRAFERLQVPPNAPLSRGTIIRIGQLVRATTVVTGRVELDGDRLAITVRAIRIDTGRVDADFEERGPLDSLFETVQRGARRLVPAAAEPSPSEPRPTLAAFEFFVRGLLAEHADTQIELFTRSLAIAPRFDRARLHLSRVHAEAGDFAQARDVALAVPPGSPLADRARFQAAVAEIALEQYGDAFERLQRLAERTGAPEVYNNLGIIQLRRGGTPQTGGPTFYFTKAADADPASPEYTFNLGYAYWRENDYPAAIYWLRETVRRDPTDGDAHFVLAAALDATGSRVEAARERELARRLSAAWEEQPETASPDDVPDGLERIRPYLEPPAARRTAQVLEQREQREQQDVVRFHLDRGRRFFERENDREALTELQRVTYLSPYEAEAHLTIGRIHLRAGRVAEAIEAFTIALWSRETPEGHVALGEAYLQAKEPERARREAERALALAPGLPEATALLERLR